MELKGIKGIDTFVQTQEPTTQTSGDVWVRPGHQGKRVWMKDRWNRPMWRDAVLDVFWAPGADYGYSCGGTFYDGDWNTHFSTIDRITFPFDNGTAIHVGNLRITTSADKSGCNSSDYGYVASMVIEITSVDRIAFPFDSGISVKVGNMSTTRGNCSSCNSSNYGFFMGGLLDSSSDLSTIDRIIFPFDSGTTTHVGNLSNNRQYPYGFNSSNYGYCLAGLFYDGATYPRFSSIERITFPFDSGTATNVGNLTASRYNHAAHNSSSYGYCMGGHTGNDYLSIIDRITFPFDSGTATHVGNLSGSCQNHVACNSSNYGYKMGGHYGVNNFSTIDRITFPFDSGTATHVGNLSGSRCENAGIDGTDFVTLFV